MSNVLISMSVEARDRLVAYLDDCVEEEMNLSPAGDEDETGLFLAEVVDTLMAARSV